MTMVGSVNFVDLSFGGNLFNGSPGSVQALFQRETALANYLQANPFYITFRPVIADITGGRTVFHAAAIEPADYSVLAESLKGFVAALPNRVFILSWPVGRAIPIIIAAGFSSSDEAKSAILFNSSSPTQSIIAVPISIGGQVGVDYSRKTFIVPNTTAIVSTEPFPSQQDAFIFYRQLGPYWFVTLTTDKAGSFTAYQDVTKWVFPRADNTADQYAIAWNYKLGAGSSPPPSAGTTPPPSGSTTPPPAGGGGAPGSAQDLLNQPWFPIAVALGVGGLVFLIMEG